MGQKLDHDSFDKVAIGTLALGDQFVMHAILLANDLFIYHPENKFYVFTDKPEVFSSLKNVVAVRHKFSGVRSCYHDKRFVVESMLKDFDRCLFLDADARLLGAIDFMEIFEEESFLTCFHSDNLEKKLKLSVINNESRSEYRMMVSKKMAENVGVSFDKITFVKEQVFAFDRRHGDVDRYFAAWNLSACYTALWLFEFAEGSAIGLGVELIGAKLRTLSKNPNWLFKDQLEDYKWKNEYEITMSRQLICVRKAIEANYGKRSKILMIPLYIYRYVRNIRNYFIAKKLFRSSI